MLNKKQALTLIHQSVIETMGCTEPIAIALGTSTANKHISSEIKSIKVILDKNVYKNARSVGIPGTDKKGIKIAIALAVINTDPKKGLLLFEDLTKQDIDAACDLLEKDLIEIDHNKVADSIYIKVEIITENERVSVLIENYHDNITLITKNDEILFEKETSYSVVKKGELKSLCLDNLIKLIDELDEDDISFLEEHVKVNLNAANTGLKQGPKKNIGATFKKIAKEDALLNSFFYKVKYIAAAASSARMSGEKIPIIGCGGSGNHGITFFISIGLAYENLSINKSISLSKALAFGLLVLTAIKTQTGLLTPMCGCSVAAATSASAAITYLLGGTKKQILSSINLVLGTISGLICDGAKPSCSLKIATSVSVAIESSLLAIHDVSICGEGITGNTLNESLSNLGILHKKGMKTVDEAILDIFACKT